VPTALIPHPPDVTPAIDRTAPRDVQFSIIPSGARLVLDGQEVRWFGRKFSLAPGQHAVVVSVPGSKCCKAHTGTVTVADLETTPGIQPITIKLDTLPATIALAGAPQGAQYMCPAIGLTGFAGGSPKVVTLPEVVWNGTCDFRPLESGTARSAKVTLRAGETNTITWPAD
jgi:serine/threonine-protein kinase